MDDPNYQAVLDDEGEPRLEYLCEKLQVWKLRHNHNDWKARDIANKVCRDLEEQQSVENRRFPIEKVVESLFSIHKYMDNRDDDEQRKLVEMIPHLNQNFLKWEPRLNQLRKDPKCSFGKFMSIFGKFIKDRNLNDYFIVAFECPGAKTWDKQNWPETNRSGSQASWRVGDEENFNKA